jgi:hypothetical protein
LKERKTQKFKSSKVLAFFYFIIFFFEEEEEEKKEKEERKPPIIIIIFSFIKIYNNNTINTNIFSIKVNTKK